MTMPDFAGPSPVQALFRDAMSQSGGRVIYLLIMFLVAGTGLATLWVQQRRARAHLETVDGFRSSLEKLAAAPAARTRRRPQAARAAAPRRTATAPAARRGAPAHRSSRRSSLDPARRAAARKRIEARRRAAARSRS
ncbi:MAG TPA: hypothetical protein VHI71_04115 [Actinomycetota bacterium]|nr:hypothetical protein [Actinomycetota bacterium]